SQVLRCVQRSSDRTLLISIKNECLPESDTVEDKIPPDMHRWRLGEQCANALTVLKGDPQLVG
ncbi:MAG: hypothetical protein SGPRY_009269, partial [Prymnesium sp.]